MTTRFGPLTTPRLVLRRLTPADATTVAVYRADPAVARYQGWHPSDADPARLAAWFADQATSDAGAPDGSGLLVAITLRSTGAVVGDCTLRMRSPGEELEPVADGPSPSAELGYSLAPAHQRHGYATEANRALCAWGFAHLGLARIVAMTDLRNRPSIAVLERLGMARFACVPTKLRGAATLAAWYELRPAALTSS